MYFTEETVSLLKKSHEDKDHVTHPPSPLRRQRHGSLPDITSEPEVHRTYHILSVLKGAIIFLIVWFIWK